MAEHFVPGTIYRLREGDRFVLCERVDADRPIFRNDAGAEFDRSPSGCCEDDGIGRADDVIHLTGFERAVLDELVDVAARLAIEEAIGVVFDRLGEFPDELFDSLPSEIHSG